MKKLTIVVVLCFFAVLSYGQNKKNVNLIYYTFLTNIIASNETLAFILHDNDTSCESKYLHYANDCANNAQITLAKIRPMLKKKLTTAELNDLSDIILFLVKESKDFNRNEIGKAQRSLFYYDNKMCTITKKIMK